MKLSRRTFLSGSAATAASGVVVGRCLAGEAPAVRIDADYPGGNIRVLRIDGDTAIVAPDLRDTQRGQWWFYWNFRLRAPAGRPIRIVFQQQNPLGVRGPAVSEDRGATWRHLGPTSVRADRAADGQQQWSFEARVPERAEEIRYAFCVPYVQSHLQTFLDAHPNNPALRVETLCRSRRDRAVELVRAGNLTDRARGVVLLTSRHHACEALATYAMEGFLAAVLADDDAGRSWRSNWEVRAIPFVDKDGVEAGDQGKNRTPHDHNRDYNERPIYTEVTEIMRRGQAMRDNVRAALDLHCPHIRGEWNDRVYIVGARDERVWEGQQAFARTLERVRRGTIPFHARDCLAFGRAWNTAANFAQGRHFASWAGETFAAARLAGTMEIPYADALGSEVTANSARALGRDLASALLEVLG